MAFALVTAGQAQEIADRADFMVGEVRYPPNVLTHWTEAELAAIGVYQIVEQAIPEGQRSTGWSLTFDGSAVTREHTLAGLAPPNVIRDRQFAQQLAILGTITEAEAIAWASRGDLPEALEQAIATLPEAGGVQFAARMLLSSATTYERSHPMTATLGAILGYGAADLDDLWRAAAAL